MAETTHYQHVPIDGKENGPSLSSGDSTLSTLRFGGTLTKVLSLVMVAIIELSLAVTQSNVRQAGPEPTHVPSRLPCISSIVIRERYSKAFRVFFALES
ncbi:MAG: hypothetical protein M1318_03420 [Firmicutes bacterium]|nr:hypothetical protein [Bacillota bacterium]